MRGLTLTISLTLTLTLTLQVSYAHVTRLHCGCPTDDAANAAAALLFLSPTLSGRLPGAPSSAEEAVLLLAQVNIYIYLCIY